MFKETSNLKSKFTDCLDLLQRFKADVSGATGIEYALIASLVGVLGCLLYTSPSPRDKRQSRMPSSA